MPTFAHTDALLLQPHSAGVDDRLPLAVRRVRIGQAVVVVIQEGFRLLANDGESNLRFPTSLPDNIIYFRFGKYAPHLHASRNNPWIGLRVRVRAIPVETILRNAGKPRQGMLELTGRIDSMAHSLLLIIMIGSILHFRPDKMSREQISLSRLRVPPVELQRIGNLPQVPARPVGKSATSALCAFSSGLHTGTSGLAYTSTYSLVSIQPDTDRRILSIWIGDHRRIKLSVLPLVKNLISNTRILRRFFGSDGKRNIRILAVKRPSVVRGTLHLRGIERHILVIHSPGNVVIILCLLDKNPIITFIP